MPLPWNRILDAVLTAGDLVGRLSSGRASVSDAALDDESAPTSADLDRRPAAGGPLEMRLAGVVVAALKETFERDTRRLEMEKQHVEAERERAERALRLELLRQSGEREIGRLRLLAGVAVAAWIATLFFAVRLAGASIAARGAVGVGWLLLVGAVAASLAAQSHVGRLLDRMEEPSFDREGLRNHAAGRLAPWLIVAGLGVIGAAVLFGA